MDAGGELGDAGVEVLCCGEDEAGALAGGEGAVGAEGCAAAALAGVAGNLLVALDLESAALCTGDLAWKTNT